MGTVDIVQYFANEMDWLLNVVIISILAPIFTIYFLNREERKRRKRRLECWPFTDKDGN